MEYAPPSAMKSGSLLPSLGDREFPVGRITFSQLTPKRIEELNDPKGYEEKDILRTLENLATMKYSAKYAHGDARLHLAPLY